MKVFNVLFVTLLLALGSSASAFADDASKAEREAMKQAEEK